MYSLYIQYINLLP